MFLPLAVITAACGTARTAEPTSGDASASSVEIVAPTKPATPIVGGTPKQRDVVREILSGLGPTRLESVEITTLAENDWGAPPDAVGFKAKMARGDGYARWQGKVVGRVFAGRSFELRLPPVAYIADEEGGGSMFYEDFSTPLSKPPLTREAAEKALVRVVEIAKEHGASTRARLLRPDRVAVAVEFRTDAPAEFLLRGLDPSLKPIDDLDWQSYDGRYVKVMDGKGEAVLESGAGLWMRGDLAGCVHYLTGVDLSEPPLCPAR
jgi:hypothetical protein